jgi:hypothetical protein
VEALVAMFAARVEDRRSVADVAEADLTFDAGRQVRLARVARLLDIDPVVDVPGKGAEEESRGRSLEGVPVDAAAEQGEVEAHYHISTCGYSGGAGSQVTAARRESHIGSQDAQFPAAEEGEEDRLLSRLVGLALGVGVVVEVPRLLWEAIVLSSVVELLALVAEEVREEGSEQLVVGPRAVVVAPDLLRQREAPSQICLAVRQGSPTDLISAQSFGQRSHIQV